MNYYLALIFHFAGTFAPRGSLFCNGQLLAIAEYDALFALLGTTYGGNGVNSFALPDLRGRLPMHAGAGPGLSTRVLGEMGGSESVTLATNQLPSHVHAATMQLPAATATASGSPSASGFLPGQTEEELYATTANATSSAGMLTLAGAGGNTPVSIMQPFLTMNYCIQVEGIFPSRN